MGKKTQVSSLTDEDTCDGYRKYLRWASQILSFFEGIKYAL